MNALECQAMLVRQLAAMDIVSQYDEEGRWDLLRMVIDPDEDALTASMEVAERTGPTKLAIEMSVRMAGEKARRRTYSFA